MTGIHCLVQSLRMCFGGIIGDYSWRGFITYARDWVWSLQGRRSCYPLEVASAHDITRNNSVPTLLIWDFLLQLGFLLEERTYSNQESFVGLIHIEHLVSQKPFGQPRLTVVTGFFLSNEARTPIVWVALHRPSPISWLNPPRHGPRAQDQISSCLT